MSLVLNLLISHLLSLLESELAAEAPAAIAMVVKEMELLKSKLESYIAIHAPKEAALINPVVTLVSSAAEAGATAAINSAESATGNGLNG